MLNREKKTFVDFAKALNLRAHAYAHNRSLKVLMSHSKR